MQLLEVSAGPSRPRRPSQVPAVPRQCSGCWAVTLLSWEPGSVSIFTRGETEAQGCHHVPLAAGPGDAVDAVILHHPSWQIAGDRRSGVQGERREDPVTWWQCHLPGSGPLSPGPSSVAPVVGLGRQVAISSVLLVWHLEVAPPVFGSVPHQPPAGLRAGRERLAS